VGVDNIDLKAAAAAGAALDVFAEEPPRLAALIQHPAVISTPHIAAQTVEAQTRAAVDIAVETLAALHGEPRRRRVV
jgi:D-3-phosphoglycerate dehydrogenase